MANFTMMIGLPASGKSTVAKSLLDENSILLSSDDIREELFGFRSEEDNARVFQEMYKRTIIALKDGKNVIYDATNINSKKRMNLLKQLPQDTFKQCIYMVASELGCIERNDNRQHTIPSHVISRMYLNLQIPMYHEGWDYIDIKRPDVVEPVSNIGKGIHIFEKTKFDYIDYKCFLKSLGFVNCDEFEFCQDNPHHTFSMLKHSYYVYEWLFDNCDLTGKNYILVAAMLHDLGKLRCKNYKEGSKYANYYGHENVSAQLAYGVLLNNQFNPQVVNEICTIIQLHMRLSYDNNWKADNKLWNMVGETTMRRLEMFRTADSSAR